VVGLVSSLTAIVAMIAVGFAAEWWLAARSVTHSGFGTTLGEVTNKPLAPSLPARRASRLLVVGYAAAIGAAIAVRLFFPTYPLPYRGDVWILAACLLAILATILRGWALITLGHFFDRDALILPDHQLLQHGPYGFIQHPAYAANILFATATGMALTTWPSTLAAASLALLAHLPRIHREEQLLYRRFPLTYPAYHQQTGRLIPHARLPTLTTVRNNVRL
jgi:protein-S-isoprenylcysteine O-methyltransferase Ste14